MTDTRTTPSDKRSLVMIGAPTDIGAKHRGASMGPEAIRVAGAEAALRRLGFDVEDWGNLTGPANPDTPPVDGYRHLKETAAWCEAVRDAVYNELRAGRLPILLGGDHSLAIGSVAAVAQHCTEQDTPFSVLWLDAHADFNTPKTSPSGNIHGMPVAILAGLGPKLLTEIGPQIPIVEASRIIQLGIRSVDAVEKANVVDSHLEVYDMRLVDEIRMLETMQKVLSRVREIGGHLHVSFDIDFLDPTIAPGVGTTVPGGPTYREAQLCMEMIYESGHMASLDLMELNPAFDDKNRTAELLVDLLGSLFGEQILSRHNPER